MKKLLSVAAIAALMSSAAYAKHINFAVPNNVGDLNPHAYSSEMFAQDLVYEGLVNYSQEGKLEPALAASWQISEDGKTYTFKLRKGVKFSNGEKFDANAVKANFDAIFAHFDDHSWSAFATEFDGLKVIDEYTVQIKLKHPYEAALRELSLVRPYRFIAPSSLSGKFAPIGTGKWVLASTELGKKDVFKRNENYWGKKVKLDEIDCVVVPDAATRTIALKSGQIDMVYGNPSYLNASIDLDSFVEFSKDKNFKTLISKPLNTTLLALNSKHLDKNIRLALNYATDKASIAKYIYHDTQPAAPFFYPADVPHTKIDRSAYAYDVEKAKEFMKKAGYALKGGYFEKDGKRAKVNLAYIGVDPEQKAIAEALASQYKKAGIELVLHADETSAFYKRAKTGEFDAIFNATWGAPYEPEIFMASFRIPSHADYKAQEGISQKPHIDELIEKEIIQATNEDKKAAAIKEVLTILHDEAIYIPLIYNTNKGVFNGKLSGLAGSIIGYQIVFDDLDYQE